MKRTALITGAARRIGRAIALELATAGYDIALHYHHSVREAQKTAAAVRDEGRLCELFQYDLSNQEEAEGLIDTIKRKLPRLEVLINNAAIFEPSKITTKDLSVFDKHFDINFKAPFILNRSFANICKKGQIINILDSHIYMNKTSHSAYLLSKKALTELTKMAAFEFAPDIRVNAIAPGIVLPPPIKTKSYLTRLAKRIPLRKKGGVEHVTSAIDFLLSNDFVTGQTIFVDGGEHLL